MRTFVVRKERTIKLVIIRHPETNKIAALPGEPDAPSPSGLERLSQIAELCREEGVEAVIHSNLLRASRAGRDLAHLLEVSAFVQEGLEERNFGTWESWEWPKISLQLNKLSLEDRYTFKPPQGESWQEMETRLIGALNDILDLGLDSVAVVTHAGPIRILLPIIRDEPKDSTLNLIPPLGECYIEYIDAIN